MASVAPDRQVVFVPRWRLFAYRAAGWTVLGNLSGAFLELEWRRPGNPVYLSPCLSDRAAGGVCRRNRRV